MSTNRLDDVFAGVRPHVVRATDGPPPEECYHVVCTACALETVVVGDCSDAIDCADAHEARHRGETPPHFVDVFLLWSSR